MKILAVDTASKSCSAAVVNQNRVLAESVLSTGETHSKTIMGLIGGVLQSSGTILEDVDAYAVTRGPGSFTGIRIGISIVKGMASAGDKSVAGISTLDALALQYSFSNCLICPMLDAKRKEVYFAKYRFDKNGRMKKEIEDSVMAPEKVISGINEPCLFVGDGSVVYHDLISKKLGELAVFAPLFANTVRASAVGYLGEEKIKSNDVYTAKSLEPFYLRKSDAEIKKS
ncbi:MAG: tRNA (adenosine(37)-N6)-threonylcarbamoyltransferase complex dimerization subunit type 1 TsaB [Deltaproteobacteria bacterium]|nr:tRNA (adenosine(37)-N6)-threonylcarbamoyltransferase complex dimerization subunit type 1 TsaB [Deltaproteobacteria bacterium]